MARLNESDVINLGYSNPIYSEEHGWCALVQFMFTWAIVSDIHEMGYVDRWCYSSEEKAKTALLSWAGKDGEPDGWHRHPISGRRINEDGTMHINF